ncbi:hypothetical protein [Halocatena halophila]|uniref:hypothetical protein n=1 Tax=Halocatena halophila TaxID=2814576 RepID=UPI002ED00D45
MRKTTIAVVVAIAIALIAVSAVSAMGIYDNTKSTETDGTTAPDINEKCQILMEQHENVSVDQCIRMIEDNGGSQMEQCGEMMQTCMQMMNGNESNQRGSSGMDGMMNSGPMGCH